MIIVIRMHGMVDVDRKVTATLDRLRLRKKYSCVIVPETKEIMGMLRKVAQYTSFGKADNEIIKELLLKRGRLVGDKPLDPKKVNDELIKNIENREYGDLKPFFRLQPPKGGFKKKGSLPYPAGVLGNNKENIKIILRKML